MYNKFRKKSKPGTEHQVKCTLGRVGTTFLQFFQMQFYFQMEKVNQQLQVYF